MREVCLASVREGGLLTFSEGDLLSTSEGGLIEPFKINREKMFPYKRVSA